MAVQAEDLPATVFAEKDQRPTIGDASLQIGIGCQRLAGTVPFHRLSPAVRS